METHSTRRTVLGALGLAGAGAAFARFAIAPGVAAAAAPASPEPVVGFHMDSPYLDLSGTATPYRPPEGLRGGDAVAAVLSRSPGALIYGI